jgi:hypothetical protein
MPIPPAPTASSLLVHLSHRTQWQENLLRGRLSHASSALVAVTEHTERLERLDQELTDQVQPGGSGRWSMPSKPYGARSSPLQ